MSLSTLHNWINHLGISYRQGWEHITSPDPYLELKLSAIEHALELAQTRPDDVIVLWLDELTVYRLLSNASVWRNDSGRPVKAHHTTGENTCLRIGDVLTTHTGQVTKRLIQNWKCAIVRLLYTNSTNLSRCPTHLCY